MVIAACVLEEKLSCSALIKPLQVPNAKRDSVPYRWGRREGGGTGLSKRVRCLGNVGGFVRLLSGGTGQPHPRIEYQAWDTAPEALVALSDPSESPCCATRIPEL